MPNVVAHGQTHRPEWVGGSDPATPVGYFEYKVYLDPGHPYAVLDPTLPIVRVGPGQFIVEITEDLDNARLVKCHCFVSVAGAVTVTLRRIRGGSAVTMLSVPLTIDAGEKSSYDAATPFAINVANAVVLTGDQIATDVLAADGTAAGLGVSFVVAAV